MFKIRQQLRDVPPDPCTYNYSTKSGNPGYAKWTLNIKMKSSLKCLRTVQVYWVGQPTGEIFIPSSRHYPSILWAT